MAEYWFNLNTQQVEEGRQSSSMNRMGPYPTREEAELALEKARARNEAADEAEEKWKEDWDGEEEHDADEW